MSETTEAAAKAAAHENMRRSYELRNQGLVIKSKTMDLLYKQVELLAEKAQGCDDEDRLLKLSAVMAMLGMAILPD